MSTLPRAFDMGNGRLRFIRPWFHLNVDVRPDSRHYTLVSLVTERELLSITVYDYVCNAGRQRPCG